jgi:phosphate transport system protein
MPTRDRLTHQINNIQDEILLLGSMVEQATLKSVQTLKLRDLKTARQVYDDDSRLNEKRFAIENAVLIIFATQQPMARDLRQLAAMLEVSTELERMGDYAKGIAKVTLRLKDAEVVTPITELEQMADQAISMLHRGLQAFVTSDLKLAMSIPPEDDQVDVLYNQVYRKLIDQMMANPSSIDACNLLMWVAHNLERLADRVTNICERTIFIATGELYEVDGSDDEDEFDSEA